MTAGASVVGGTQHSSEGQVVVAFLKHSGVRRDRADASKHVREYIRRADLRRRRSVLRRKSPKGVIDVICSHAAFDFFHSIAVSIICMVSNNPSSARAEQQILFSPCRAESRAYPAAGSAFATLTLHRRLFTFRAFSADL